jgi:hypothetical protein
MQGGAAAHSPFDQLCRRPAWHRGSADDFKSAAGRGVAAGVMVSIKSDRPAEAAQEEEEQVEGKQGSKQKGGKQHGGHGGGKKKHSGGQQQGGKPHKKHKSG